MTYEMCKYDMFWRYVFARDQYSWRVAKCTPKGCVGQGELGMCMQRRHLCVSLQ